MKSARRVRGRRKDGPATGPSICSLPRAAVTQGLASMLCSRDLQCFSIACSQLHNMLASSRALFHTQPHIQDDSRTHWEHKKTKALEAFDRSLQILSEVQVPPVGDIEIIRSYTRPASAVVIIVRAALILTGKRPSKVWKDIRRILRMGERFITDLKTLKTEVLERSFSIPSPRLHRVVSCLTKSRPELNSENVLSLRQISRKSSACVRLAEFLKAVVQVAEAVQLMSDLEKEMQCAAHVALRERTPSGMDETSLSDGFHSTDLSFSSIDFSTSDISSCLTENMDEAEGHLTEQDKEGVQSSLSTDEPGRYAMSTMGLDGATGVEGHNCLANDESDVKSNIRALLSHEHPAPAAETSFASGTSKAETASWMLKMKKLTQYLSTTSAYIQDCKSLITAAHTVVDIDAVAQPDRLLAKDQTKCEDSPAVRERNVRGLNVQALAENLKLAIADADISRHDLERDLFALEDLILRVTMGKLKEPHTIVNEKGNLLSTNTQLDASASAVRTEAKGGLVPGLSQQRKSSTTGTRASLKDKRQTQSRKKQHQCSQFRHSGPPEDNQSNDTKTKNSSQHPVPKSPLFGYNRGSYPKVVNQVANLTQGSRKETSSASRSKWSARRTSAIFVSQADRSRLANP